MVTGLHWADWYKPSLTIASLHEAQLIEQKSRRLALW
jgi:hypothetical protein